MKEIWDKKAATFPRYGQFGDEDKPIFEFFENAVNLKNKNILDLGCGNGRYALGLAKSAKTLFALDISENMLKNVKEDAQKYKINNIKTFCADWEEFDVSDFGEHIDMVFASLTPALNSFERFKKAYNLAREGMLYIGWGRRRENAFLDSVFSAHNVKVELPIGAPNIPEYLEKMNKTIPPIHFVLKEIHNKKTLDDAVNDAKWQLEAHKFEPNVNLIREVAQTWEKDGIVEYISYMEVGLMVILK